MQGVHDGNIVLKDGQTMLQGYQAYLASTSQGFTLATLKVKALSVSMKLLSSIGWVALITGASWLASKGVEALDKIINREKYLKKAVEESASAYESVKSQVESLNSELETTKSRIDELNAKDSLTFIEQEELDKLKDATAELKTQLLLMEEEEQKKKVQYLEDQTKLYNEKYKDQFDPTSPAIGQVLSLLKDYNIKDFIEAINLLNEINGTSDESGYVYDFTDDISNSIADKKSEYEEYKTYLIEFLGDLYEELGDEAFGTELYQTIKQDLIQSAQLFGDNVTLSNYMFTDDQMQDVKNQIINYFTNGGTIEGVSEAIGDSLYQSFSDACNKLGIPISEMLNNMYAEATDNLDPVWLQNKMLQSFQDIAIANDVEEEYVSTQKELQEYTRDFTNTQKQLWIEATEGATSATEAVNLYKQALYGNDRNSYISDHLTNLLVPTKQDGEFYNFINSLDDEDYQIVLKLDVDASTPIEQIQEQIRNSKEEFSDIFSAIFSGTGDDAVTFEDALGNTKDTIEEIKGYLDDLYENGIKELSSEAISSIEKLAPGFSSALAGAEDKTGAAIEYLTQLLEKQDDEIVKFLDSLLALENLSDSTVAYIENLKATLQDETTYTRDLGGLLAEYQTGAKLDDLFYAFQDGNAKSYRDAIDDASSRISSLTEAYDKLWEYQLKVGEASNDIDSAEFTKFITDLIREFPELAQYTDGTINSIEGLREAIARLCETEPNEIVSALQELSDSADLTEEMRNQIDLLIDSLSNLSTIDMSMDTTKNVISDMCTEMDNLVDLMDLINNKGLKIDVSDAQKYLEIYPEMLANAVPAGDGMIQLNEDVVNSFIEGKKAEIEADGEARIQELQNANAVLESKIAYEQAKIQIAQEALNSVSTMDDAEAVNKINNLQGTLDASIQAGNDELTAYDLATQAMMGDSDALNLLNKTASEEASANWASSFLQSDVNSGKASYAIQKNLEYIINMANGVANAIRSMITGKTTGSPGVRTTSGGGYSGSTGKTSTTSSGNTKSGGMLSNILGAIGGNLRNFIDSVKGSVKNVVDTTLNNISGVFGKLNANLSNSNSSLQLIDIINTANANIEDYKNAIASNNQQITMIKAFGAGDIDKYVAKKLADKNAGTSGSNGSKGSGGKGGDGGSSANETKEIIDWIEIKLDKTQKKIDKFIQDAESALDNKDYESAISNYEKAISAITFKVTDQQEAAARYETLAKAILEQSIYSGEIDRDFANEIIFKVANGSMDINEYSESIRDIINSYQEWIQKAEDAKETIDALHASIKEYTISIKEVADAQRDASIERYDLYSSVGGTFYSFTSPAKKSQLLASNAQLKLGMEAYRNETNNMQKNVGTAATNAKLLISNAKNNATDKYREALQKAEKAIESNHRVSDPVLKVILDNNRNVYEQLYAYNMAIDNLETARLEESLNLASAWAEISQNISDIYASMDDETNKRIDLYNSKSQNAQTIKIKNVYLDLVAKQYDKIISDDQKEIEQYKSIENSNKNIIGNNMNTSRGAKYNGLPDNVKKEIDKCINSAKNAAYKGQTIGADVLTKLADYVAKGYVTESFYESCFKYNDALQRRIEAENQYEIDKQTAIQEKASIGTQKIQNIQTNAENKRNAYSHINNKIGYQQQLVTTKGGTLGKRSLQIQIMQEKHDLDAYIQEARDIRKQNEQNVKDGLYTIASQEYKDMEQAAASAEKSAIDCSINIHEIQNAIDTLDITKLEDMADVFSSMVSYLKSMLSSMQASGKYENIGTYQKIISRSYDEYKNYKEQAGIDYENWKKAKSDPSGGFGGKSANEWLRAMYDDLANANNAIAEVYENQKSLRELPLQILNDEMGNLKTILDVISSKADLKEAEGHYLNVIDYQKQISATNDEIAKQEAINLHNKMLYEDAIARGATADAAEYFDAWKSGESALNDMKSSVESLNDKIRDDFVESVNRAIDAINDIRGVVESEINIKQAEGKYLNASDYEKQIRLNTQEYQSQQQIISDRYEKYNEALIAGNEAEAEQMLSQARQAEIAANNLLAANVELQKSIQNLFRDTIQRELDALDSAQNVLESKIELLKAQDRDLTKYDYQQQINSNMQLITKQQALARENRRLYELELSRGNLEAAAEYLKDWKAAETEVNNLRSDIESLGDEMRKALLTKDIDEYLDKLDQLRNSLSTISGIIDDDMMYDDTGHLSNFGITALAMNIKEYESNIDSLKGLLEKRDKYIEEYRTGKNAYYSKNEFNEDMKNITKEIQDMLANAADSRKAIISMIVETSKVEIEALDDVIQKRIELLQTQKDAYDFDKSLKSKTNDLAMLEKQKEALDGLTDKESLAKVQKLNKQIKEAQEDLDATITDHAFELKIDGLNDLKDDISEAYENYVKQLNANLESITEAVTDASNLVSGSLGTVEKAISKLLASYGIEGLDKETIGYIRQYATGTKYHPGGSAIINEEGAEMLVMPDKSLLIPELPRSTGVINAEMTRNLMNMAKYGSTLPKSTLANLNNGNTSVNIDGVAINIYDATDPENVMNVIKKNIKTVAKDVGSEFSKNINKSGIKRTWG